jgi:epoxyqueuosine reductase
MMKTNFVDKGASRYVVGKVERFDEKNTIFPRLLWDAKMLDVGRKFYGAEVMPRDKPGYQLKDMAMVNAAWRLETNFARGNFGGRMGLYAWEWGGKFDYPRVPSGLKISVDDPLKVTKDLKKVASLFGASLVGVCELDRRWLYSHAYLFSDTGGKSVENEIPKEYKYAIAIAIEMDYEGIRRSPAYPASAVVGIAYSKMAFVAGLLANFIRGLGYQAIPCGNDTACSIPIAIDAGLGELARNGLLITPEFGPRVRLAKVFTDLPLIPDSPIEFGVWAFCLKCGKCAQNCPSQSIMYREPTEQTNNISNREGLLRWPVNAETCIGFWAKETDCSNCIRTCPFNKPSGWLHKSVRWGIRNARCLDPFFLWMDDLLGYGKSAKANSFWTNIRKSS